MSNRSHGSSPKDIPSCTINQLPLEILFMICQKLPREDLRAARVVSRGLNNAAQSLLFRTVYTRSLLHSIQNLEDIADHVDLRNHVRTLCYDASEFPESPLFNFRSWCKYHAGLGLGLTSYYQRSRPVGAADVYFTFGQVRRMFLDGLSEALLEKCYFHYCHHVFGQKYLFTRGNWRRMMRGALNQFHRVSEVRFAAGEEGVEIPVDSASQIGTPAVSSLSKIGRTILAQPSRIPRDCCTTFWELLRAVWRPRGSQIEKIIGMNLLLDELLKATSAFPDYDQMFSELHSLALGFEEFSLRFGERGACLATIIAVAASVRSLRLHFPGLSRNMLANTEPLITAQYQRNHFIPLGIHLYTVLGTAQWANLRELKLSGLLATEKILRTVIVTQAPRLQDLVLGLAELELTSLPPEYKRTSWIEFIHTLEFHSSLEHVLFQYVFTSADDAWQAEGIQARYFGRYKSHAPCSCPLNDANHTEKDIKAEEGGGLSWYFSDLTGWFDDQLREICNCTVEPTGRHDLRDDVFLVYDDD